MSTFNYIDTVKNGLNAGVARTPRMHKSAVAEFGRILSGEVSAGDWSQDGDDRTINSTGQTVEEYLDHLISTRPHWLVPATVVDKADDTWTSGDLTKQGKRWKELRDFLGNDAATNAACSAEAALYGAKMGSTVKGFKPGTKPDDGEPTAGPSNPWSDAYEKRMGIEEARETRGRLMKTRGLPACTAMAKAAGKTVTGVKLK